MRLFYSSLLCFKLNECIYILIKNALNKFIFVEEAEINQTKYLIEMRDTQKLKEKKLLYIYTRFIRKIINVY